MKELVYGLLFLFGPAVAVWVLAYGLSLLGPTLGLLGLVVVVCLLGSEGGHD